MEQVKRPKKPLMFYYTIVLIILILFNIIAMPYIKEKQISYILFTMKDSKEEKQMRYLYEKADHLHDKCKISTNTIFLLYTIAASFVIGFAVMTVGALATGHPLGESLMLIMVGALYISAGLGFFGGVLYLMRR